MTANQPDDWQPNAQVLDLGNRIAQFDEPVTIPIAWLDGGISASAKGDYKVKFVIPAEYSQVMLELVKVRGIPVTIRIDKWENSESE